MSAAALHESFWHEAYWRKPYRLPAGILALAVHGAFFALLYFGFSWQSMPFQVMRVELWQSLPEPVDAPFEKPVAKEVLHPAQPVKMDKPDIVLPDKKKIEAKRVEKKPVKKKVEAKPVVQKHVEQKPIEQKLAEKKQDDRIAEQAEREQAEQAAAKGRVVDEYKTRIQNKITRNIVMPPGVPDDALAVFHVTLLPGGSVLSADLEKSSGNAAYDNAVERAILKSDPLPLPSDTRLFKDFRVLRLKFRPGQ